MVDDTKIYKESRKGVLMDAAIDFCAYYRITLFWVFLAFQTDAQPASVVFKHLRPVERNLCKFCALDPRGSLELDLFHAITKRGFKPKDYSVGFAAS